MRQERIGIIGAGYVGLPVALAFAHAGFDVQVYDANPKRIAELRIGDDRTGQCSPDEIGVLAGRLHADWAALADRTAVIVLVQTTVHDGLVDLSAVINAVCTVAGSMQPGTLVVIGSTVTVGFTEAVVKKHLEEGSGMMVGRDFGLAYAPERVDPGNAAYPYRKVQKVVSALDPTTLERVAKLYGEIGLVGVVAAPSVKVAEAARILENTQRDANIALMNEAAAIFALHHIDMGDVLSVARTKWNFLDFHPGLVGGHCVNVHTYFLGDAALKRNFDPVLTSAIRQSNDLVPERIVRACTERLMSHQPKLPATVSVFGLTYKENVPDMRGTLLRPIVDGLKRHGCVVQLADPLARNDDVVAALGVAAMDEMAMAPADAVLITVPHAAYRARGWDLVRQHLKPCAKTVIDVRGILDRTTAPPGITPWRL